MASKFFDDLLDNLFDDDVEEDTIDDCIEDAEFEELDLDNDGYNETLKISYDTDGDGVIDTTDTYTDYNFDGVADSYSQHSFFDNNSDGNVDMIIYKTDTNGDLNIDRHEVFNDDDGDGIYEKQTIYNDRDLNGRLDDRYEINHMDNNKDGIFDTNRVNYDSNNDGIIEYGSTMMDYNQDGIIDITINESYNTGITYNRNFDPQSEIVDYDDVVGDPAGDMEHWHQQTYDDTCAVVSQEFVLEELLGTDFDENDLRDIAIENGWYTPDVGTPAEHVGDLLEYYGLDVDRVTNASVEDIKNCLDNGGSVIVGLDADEIWQEGTNNVQDELLEDPIFAPGKDANHAVEVIGIDSSDPNNVQVILNDPGSPTGCGSMIPIDEFVDAWDDSDNLLVTAYK